GDVGQGEQRRQLLDDRRLVRRPPGPGALPDRRGLRPLRRADLEGGGQEQGGEQDAFHALPSTFGGAGGAGAGISTPARRPPAPRRPATTATAASRTSASPSRPESLCVSAGCSSRAAAARPP